MAATAPSLPWVPEDDVLLKRSVEAGASLESLAKGAVQFSRRYTLKEIQDRWYSLLYDPVTVMEASPHMFEVERLEYMKPSKPIKPESAKETQFGSRKRKSDSLRKLYYAKRKRICNDPFDISAIDLLPKTNSSNNNLGAQDQEFDPFPEFGPLTPYENTQFGSGLDTELPLCDLFEPKGLNDHGNESRPSPCEQGQSDQDAFTVLQLSNSENKVNNFLAKISDLLFIDNDGKETIDDSYYDGLSSLILDDIPQVETSMPDKILGPEYTNGVICCTLNSNGTEIPSNEDVFLPFISPSSSDSPHGATRRSEDSSCSVLPPSVKKTPRGRKPPPVAKNKQKNSCVMGPSQPSDGGLKHLVKDKGVKFELPKSSINHMALRNTRSVVDGNTSRINLANLTANCYIGGESGLEVLRRLNKNNDNKAQLSGSEEWSENDVPCFSDVEAMILEMDLTPDAHLDTSSLAVKYPDEESKRTIIRLEQAADACTQRDASSQSAFAILHSRWNKHFIRKPEVILGRSTEVNSVDIDLGREKNGGKISRRQARIKLDSHGVFQLTNLGNNTILVNKTDVLPGESCRLDSKSLIGVRGLAFSFFVNRKLVDEFVSSNGECSLPLGCKPSNGS